MRWCLALGAAVVAGCGQAENLPQDLPRTVLEIGGQKLSVQVADDEAERSKGLMFVKNMPQGEGMVFVWPEAEARSFWMKNTFIPLDILYIRGREVVSVVAWAKPHDETGLASGAAADMVLEVNGGWAAAHNVGVGSVVSLTF